MPTKKSAIDAAKKTKGAAPVEDQISLARNVEDWTYNDVATWLSLNSLTEYGPVFRQQKIDGKVLLLMEDADLSSPLLNIQSLGDLKKLSFSLKELKESFHQMEGYTGRYKTNAHWKDDLPKFLVSLMFMVLVSFCTAITMTIVHDRVPDTATYPPLPDIFLDNIQLIPFAFELAEFIILTLGGIFTLIVLLHKHRLIVLRRFFAIAATVFLLRCVTMFVTSLSVPGVHLKCDVRVGASMDEKIEHAMRIMRGLALSINGLRTCGDYMFSGHTIVMTLLNFFVNEYSPASYEGLRIMTWVLNIFGMFFVLAAHEHYTIDVVVAFYISSRMFVHYHDLANSITATNPLNSMRRAVFPMFHYFEDCTEGTVPNEYEWPWTGVYQWLKRRMNNKTKAN